MSEASEHKQEAGAPREVAVAPDKGAELSCYGLIYMIEDSSVQARYMATQLGYFGYEVEVFSNTGDALEALGQFTPKVVLTDINLPEGDMAGLHAVPKIKQSSPEPPFVVALSTHADFQTRLLAVKVGVDGYYVKPANVPQLVDHIDRLTNIQPDESLNVLVVDDQATAANYYAQILEKEGMRATTLTDPARILDVMSEQRPDVLLCDMQMPACNGFELAGIIRQIDAFAGVPVVFQTGSDVSMLNQIDSLKYGGDEFLSKSTAPEWLASVVRTRGTRYRQMERHMFRDSMTGLYKHAAIKENLSREIARAKRTSTDLCFCMIDIDKFKSVNDTYGHAVGDRVIISLARLLTQNLRIGDIVGRYGGEEFAVILPNCSPQDAFSVMDRLRARFAKVAHAAENKIFLSSFSCGIASVKDFDDPSVIVEQADAALYQAKRNGRNRVELAPATAT